ncbi:DUF397 domain-containing protein [Streptomyces sp. NBC_01485]|uniref:DUF397 domain-containing protein n=1 Tax=Streptomyces sp. NBC_01485 TaxID=2903884 RepID=UPI002E319A55|nr:DUF397 domain-containing protein [Streptomyces sp. NBC_01485]
MPLPLTGWHKSRYSTDFEDACVEACADGPGRGVHIRDSKDRGLRPLTVSSSAWRAFLGSGRFTTPGNRTLRARGHEGLMRDYRSESGLRPSA